jgi:hypothetical protein
MIYHGGEAWNKYGWPTCGKCNQPVEKITQYRDFETDSLALVAHCHGDTERVLIPSDVFMADGFDPSQVRIDGVVFKTHYLPA